MELHGFKLHLAINAAGVIIQAMFTPDNTNAWAPLVRQAFTQKLFGRLVGDKWQISQSLSEGLWEKGNRQVARIKRNMRSRVMAGKVKLLLRQRAVVEPIIGMLRLVCIIEHTQQRSFPGFVANLGSDLIAYSVSPNMPKFILTTVEGDTSNYALNRNCVPHVFSPPHGRIAHAATQSQSDCAHWDTALRVQSFAASAPSS